MRRCSFGTLRNQRQFGSREPIPDKSMTVSRQRPAFHHSIALQETEIVEPRALGSRMIGQL
jgi:hypothetical protein